MHPYTAVIKTQTFNTLVMEALKDRPEFEVAWKYILTAPDPGQVLCGVCNAVGLGDLLFATMRPFITVPDLDYGDFFEDPTAHVASNKEAIDHRYSILSPSQSISENYTLGFNTGILLGLIEAQQKGTTVHSLDTKSAMVLQNSLQASEQLGLMGYLGSSCKSSIESLTSHIRSQGERLKAEHKAENEGIKGIKDIGDFISNLEKDINKRGQ